MSTQNYPDGFLLPDTQQIKALMKRGNTDVPLCAFCGVILLRINWDYWEVERIYYTDGSCQIFYNQPKNLPTGYALVQIDHIVPKVRGGGDSRYNQLLLCGTCNNRKSDLTAIEFIRYLKIKGLYKGLFGCAEEHFKTAELKFPPSDASKRHTRSRAYQLWKVENPD